METKPNEGIRRTRQRTGVGSGAHNRTTLQNSKLGRKGGKTQTERTKNRGFASFDADKLKEITKKGGVNRWAQQSGEL